MEYKILSLNEKSFTFASPPHSVCVKFVLVSKEFLEIDSNLQITVMTRLPDKYTHTHTHRGMPTGRGKPAAYLQGSDEPQHLPSGYL